MVNHGTYGEIYRRSIDDPEGFWGEQARLVDWIRKPTRVLDSDRPPFYRWYSDGTLNTCFNALDRHVVAGHGDRVALIYDSPVTGTKQTFTYADLVEKVATFAGALRGFGVEKGDRVVIYLPMSVEGVVAMQACARLGAVHSVVFGGFSAQSLRDRIDDAGAVAVITADEQLYIGHVTNKPRHTQQVDYFVYEHDLRTKEIPAGVRRAQTVAS